jgi:hypothetical protein
MTNGEIGKSRVQQDRAARAGAALRENLKRRKEQARGRKAQTAGEGRDQEPAKSHDSAGFVPDKPKG